MEVTITMNEDEIITAIKNFLNAQEVILAGKAVEVNMVAGRGTNGHSAVIKISNDKLHQTEGADATGPANPEPAPKVTKAKDTAPAEPKVTAPPVKGADVTPTDTATLFADAEQPATEPDPAADLNDLGESLPEVTEAAGTEEVASLFQ